MEQKFFALFSIKNLDPLKKILAIGGNRTHDLEWNDFQTILFLLLRHRRRGGFQLPQKNRVLDHRVLSVYPRLFKNFICLNLELIENQTNSAYFWAGAQNYDMEIFGWEWQWNDVNDWKYHNWAFGGKK